MTSGMVFDAAGNADFLSVVCESLTGYAIAAIDFDGRIIAYNEGARAIYGYAPEEVIGKASIEVLFPPEFVDAGSLSQIVDELLTLGRASFEGQQVRKNGERFPAQILFSSCRDGSGKIVGFVQIAEDVTERRRAEDLMRQSEERLQSVFDGLVDGVLVADQDTKKFVLCNPAICRMLGYSQEELLALGVADIHPEDVMGSVREHFASRLEKEGPVSLPISVKRKDGSTFAAEIAASPVVLGTTRHLLAVCRDVTERKRMEARIVEVNHELRELTAHLETVREEERAEVAWELHDHVAQALSVLKVDLNSCRSRLSDDALGVVAPTMDGMTQVLDETIGRLRKLYADLVPVMLEDLGLAATIEWQAEEFARRTGVECELRRVEDIKLPRGRVALGMFRVLQEACDNVRRHSGATKVTVDFERVGDDALLRVADNGHGFAEDEVKKPGAIGLTGIRERVRSWGGRMNLNTSVGAGTVLEVTAPLQDDPAGKTMPESADINGETKT